MSNHPEPADLLAFAGGELSGAEAAQVQKHAAACSECRVQLEEWRAALWDYAAFHHQELKPSLPPPPRPWKPLGRGRLGWMPRIRDPRIWAALAAGVLLGVFLYQTAEETVSAAEILDKAQARETAASAPAERRIRIRTGSASFVRPAVMTSEREDLSSLRSLFEQANYSWDDPLSARSFARWRSQLPSKEDEVRVVTDNAASPARYYRIRTTTGHGALAAASLTLRATDLSPVAETLQFRNNELVEITEALTDDEPAPAIPPAHMAAAPPSPATPGPADELRVLAALNRLGADLGEPVEVHRDARRVIVSGLGLDLSRQDQIRDAVGRLPHVALRFEDPRPAPETAMIAADSLAMPVPEAVHEELEQQLGGPAAVEEYINRLLDASESALARAHALRRLAERFPPQVEQELDEEDRALLDSLRRRHVSALVRLSDPFAKALEPAAGFLALPPEEFACRPWQSCVAALVEATQTLDTLINRAVAGSGASAAPSRAALRAAYQAWRTRLRALEPL